ncbi:MAG TPA: alpha/beta hydrolase domain-containing protein [Acidimicrobiales bacterium]
MAATFEGPITGGERGRPSGSPLIDLATVGYVEEEWFLAGDAVTYDFVAGAEPTADGRWQTEATGTMPYRTRVLLRRPIDPARFNGTVVVSWNNVSAGFEILQWEGPETWEGGYVTVGVSAQRVGLTGYKADPRGLLAWDSERYGSLSIPSDAASYDIFATAIRLVSPAQAATGLLPGYDVRRVVATGASQSAGRLHTYVNAIHPHVGLVDGYILDVYAGTGAPIARRPPDGAMMPYPAGQLRDDLGVRILHTNSETEVLAYAPIRRADTDGFVYWEMAGMAHGGASEQVTAAKNDRDWGFPLGAPVERPADLVMNELDKQPVEDASLVAMQRWLVDGTTPPSLAKVSVAGEPPAIVRDADGIAEGGLRLPEVVVPVATLSGTNSGSRMIQLVGSRVDFTPERLRKLYPDHAAYVARFRAAADAAVAVGYLLARDADTLVAQAEAAPVP